MYATQQRRQRRRMNPRRLDDMLAYVAAFAILTLCSALIALLLAEWVVGCGEIAYYPDGTWKTIDCIVLPHEERSGTWK